jgi:hypothetical protein
VIVVLAPRLARLAGAPWEVSFPGTGIPAESWLRSNDGRSVGLFQNEASQFTSPTVRVVVWVGERMRVSGASSPSTLAAIPTWIEPQLADQATALAAEAAEAKRKQALPLPSLDAVLGVLRGGQRVCTGGGRYSTTYFIDGGVLRKLIIEEGYSQEDDASEDELRGAIADDPDAFRKWLPA